MRKVSAGIATMAAISAMTLASCAGTTTTTTPATGGGAAPGATTTTGGTSGEKPYIAIVSKGFQHQFWQAVKKGAEQEAAKQNATITFEGPASESEVEAQINMLQSAIAKKPAAIGFAALDSKAASSLLDQIKTANIPLIAFDSGVESDIPLTTTATDNKAAAGEAAKNMCKLLKNKGKVGVIVHDQVSKSGTDRRDGFLDGMKATCPDVTVLPPQYGGGDQAKSADIIKSMIAANPDMTGIFGSNEGSAIGAVKGVQESGKKDLVLIGFDSGKAQIDAINNGLMSGAITQNPVGMGKELVKAALKAIKGEQLEKVIDTGYYWYDKNNINENKIKAALYE